MLAVSLLLASATPAVTAAATPAVPTEPAAPVALPDPGQTATGYWQVVIEQRVIIRVPARQNSMTSFSSAPGPMLRQQPQPIVWREVKAPKCVPMRTLIGMQAVQRDSIDLVTRENHRLRATLNRGCRALDFYAGFYMRPSKDGQLCEDRDTIHARSGAECEIDKFRLIVPVRRED